VIAAVMIVVLVAAGSLAVWALVIGRWRRGLPLVPSGETGRPAWNPVALVITLGWLGMGLLGRFRADRPADVDLRDVQENCALLGVLFVILLLPLAYAGPRGLRDFGWRRENAGTQVGIGALTFLASILPVGFVLASTAARRSADALHPFLRLIAAEPGPTTIAWVAFAAVVLAPLLEELMYRVILQGSLERVASPAVAIVGVALVFSAVHNPIDVLPLVPLALILGYVYHRTRSYLAVVTAHALFNSTMLVLMLVTPPAEDPAEPPMAPAERQVSTHTY
jgi:membrane protease YdiL (CAAX protease family)